VTRYGGWGQPQLRQRQVRVQWHRVLHQHPRPERRCGCEGRRCRAHGLGRQQLLVHVRPVRGAAGL